MLSIFSIFGPSPFSPIHDHMQQIWFCVEKLPLLLHAIQQGQDNNVQEIADEIFRLKQIADVSKNNIRDLLPNAFFLHVERTNILKIIELQDEIAHVAREVAMMISVKTMSLPKELENDLQQCFMKNTYAVEQVLKMTQQLSEMMKSPFGSFGEDHIRSKWSHICYVEYESDLLEKNLLRELFKLEGRISHGTFYLWLKIIRLLTQLSHIADDLGYRINMILKRK